MKNDLGSSRMGLLFFLLTLVVALLSWIGSIYGVGEVQSLLSAEGIRWVLGHVVSNYVQCPALGLMLILFMGGGIVVQSGLYDILKRYCRKEKQLSRKERRALVSASVVLLVYTIGIALSVCLPGNFLLSVTGSWLHSPLAEGFVYILSVGVGLTGMVYGYVSDTFRSIMDVVQSMASLIASRAFSLVTLFFVVQFFSSLMYTHLAEWAGVSNDIVHMVYFVCCFLTVFKFPLSTRAR